MNHEMQGFVVYFYCFFNSNCCWVMLEEMKAMLHSWIFTNHSFSSFLNLWVISYFTYNLLINATSKTMWWLSLTYVYPLQKGCCPSAIRLSSGNCLAVHWRNFTGSDHSRNLPSLNAVSYYPLHTTEVSCL